MTRLFLLGILCSLSIWSMEKDLSIDVEDLRADIILQIKEAEIKGQPERLRQLLMDTSLSPKLVALIRSALDRLEGDQ